jgi:hypothetical protein
VRRGGGGFSRGKEYRGKQKNVDKKMGLNRKLQKFTKLARKQQTPAYYCVFRNTVVPLKG